MTNLRWLPNFISLSRVAIVPVVVGAIASGRFQLAAILFFVAGVSDGLDGFLARRYKWSTPIGGILDPIADKFLMMGTFAALALSGLIGWWLAAMVILRDVVIISGAIYYHFAYSDLVAEPSAVSKVNTLLELVLVVLVLFSQLPLLAALGGTIVAMTGHVLVVLQIVLIVTLLFSTFGYIRTWLQRAREATT